MRRFEIVPAREPFPEAPLDLPAAVAVVRQVEKDVRRLIAVGDVGFCGRFAAAPADPWLEVGPLLRSGDLLFANLETPLVDSQATPFVAPPSAVGRLVGGGFSVLSVANNHVADAGPEGIFATCAVLGEAGIAAVGAGTTPEEARRLVVADLAGSRVGWLGCARTLERQLAAGPAFWELDPEALRAAVRRHRAEVDLLAVSIHFGYMYVDYPDPDHRRLALALAEDGADLVLAHHAHVAQGIEVSARGAVVCHNLGDFFFDWTAGEFPMTRMAEAQRQGIVVALDCDRDGVRRLAVLPTRVDDGGIVRWAVGEPGRKALERLVRISDALTGDYAAAFHRQRGERNTGLAVRTLLRHLRRGELRVLFEVLVRLRCHHLRMLFAWLRGRRG